MIFNTIFRTHNRDEQNTSIDSKTSLDFEEQIIEKIVRADFADSRRLSKAVLVRRQRNASRLNFCVGSTEATVNNLKLSNLNLD